MTFKTNKGCGNYQKTKLRRRTLPVRFISPLIREKPREAVVRNLIGETKRSLKNRLLVQHLPKSMSFEVSQHIHIESRDTTLKWNKLKSWSRNQWAFREMCEGSPIYIWVNKSLLNKDGADTSYHVCLIRFLSHVSGRSLTPYLGCQSPDEYRKIDRKFKEGQNVVLRS